MSIWCLTAVLSGRLESELSESRVFTGKEQAKQTERISADLLIIILFNKLLASSQIINRNIVTLWQRLMGSLGKLITLWRAHISRSDWAISAIAFTSQTMTSHKCARNGLSAAKDCLSLSTSHSQWFGFNLFIELFICKHFTRQPFHSDVHLDVLLNVLLDVHSDVRLSTGTFGKVYWELVDR